MPGTTPDTYVCCIEAEIAMQELDICISLVSIKPRSIVIGFWQQLYSCLFTFRYTGVTHSSVGRWSAKIQVSNHIHSLGMYDSEQTAARVYDEACIVAQVSYAFHRGCLAALAQGISLMQYNRDKVCHVVFQLTW